MALAKMTPTHIAIQTLDDTIASLKKQKAALIALLPKKKKGPLRKEDRFIVNPLTGKKEYY